MLKMSLRGGRPRRPTKQSRGLLRDCRARLRLARNDNILLDFKKLCSQTKCFLKSNIRQWAFCF